jgi:phospholipid/cholesterol/gamma-HCH transport system substrate-binding protein
MSITTDSNSAIRDGRMGVFMLISIIFLMGSYLWFKAVSPWNPQQRFSVHFHEIAALNDNAPILVNGVRVGSVESIHLKGKDAVHVRMQINKSKITIPEGATFKILSNNVVGVKYVDISLPKSDPNKPPPRPLDETMEIVGQDPGRPEVIIDELTASLSKISFEKLEKKVAKNFDDIANASANISKASEKLGPVADKTMAMEDKVGYLADEVRTTSKRINKIIDNPQFVADLKETARRARDVAASIERTMNQVDSLLADRDLRNDVKESLARLNDATKHVQSGLETFEKLAQDKEVRGDLKAIMVDARHALDKVDSMVNSPGFGDDLKGTLKNTNAALENINTVTLQVNQILSKRHPLLHMIFGAPGKLDVKARLHKKQEKELKDKDRDTNAHDTVSPRPREASSSPSSNTPVVDEINKPSPTND